MYLIEKRVNAITFKNGEAEELNPLIIEYQELTGKPFENIKDLFISLLSSAIAYENNENTEAENPAIVESKENSIEIPENSEDKEKFLKSIEDFRESNSMGAEVPASQVIYMGMKTAMKPPETITPETITEIEYKEKELEKNQFVLTLTDEPGRPIEKKLIILDEIQKRRHRKYGNLEPMPVLLEKMVFNPSTILNLGGEFYTGF